MRDEASAALVDVLQHLEWPAPEPSDPPPAEGGWAYVVWLTHATGAGQDLTERVTALREPVRDCELTTELADALAAQPPPRSNDASTTAYRATVHSQLVQSLSTGRAGGAGVPVPAGFELLRPGHLDGRWVYRGPIDLDRAYQDLQQRLADGAWGTSANRARISLGPDGSSFGSARVEVRRGDVQAELHLERQQQDPATTLTILVR